MTKAQARQKNNERAGRRRAFDEKAFDREVERVIEHFPERGYIILDVDETEARDWAKHPSQGFTVTDEIVVNRMKKGDDLSTGQLEEIADMGINIVAVDYEFEGVQIGYETRELTGYKVEF